MRNLTMLLLFSGLIAGTAIALDNSVTLTLNAENGSGESGTATLFPEGKQTKVVINMVNTPAGVAQPAHIHEGRCDNLNKKPKWPLEPVKDGRSQTVVAASIDEITKNPTAINIHKSAEEAQVYVACGNIVPTY
jgi:Cu/Zn superoxide dismutase